jgi:hypothetical protein
MLSVSILRRSASIAVVALLAMVGLLMAMSLRTTANAEPAYPPTVPCTSGAASSSVASGSTCSSSPADPAVTHRTKLTNTDPAGTSTASTGFAAITASVIAVALLGGGGLLLVIGRRRKQT